MKRLIYKGRIRLPHGYHSGDGRRLDVVDQPLARDADGHLELAGSSLAGVLRSDLLRLARAARSSPRCRADPGCRCVTCRLFGPRAESRRQDDNESLRSSRLYVRGGRLVKSPQTRLRDRVGIDRKTGTAADRRKYDIEVAEAVEFACELRIDEPDDDEIRHLEAVLRRLATGWLFLGGKSASGLGRAELVELRRTTLDLGRLPTLVKHLQEDKITAGGQEVDLLGQPGWLDSWELEPAAPTDVECTKDLATAGDWAQIRLGLALELPHGLLVNDPAEAMMGGFDHAFLRIDDRHPLLPGSTLRGALRSRAEAILRTLGGPAAACDLNTQGAACHQRIEAARKKVRKRVRGSVDERAEHCMACRVFGSGRLASAFKLTDFARHPEQELNAEADLLVHEMVAIDRFTGGAADGAKFDAQVSAPVVLHGELSCELGPDRLEPWGLGLLLLALRDLLLGDVPFGFGTAKGLNEYQARVTSAHRFWVYAPAFLGPAGEAPGDAPGMASWNAGETAGLDRPSAFAAILPPALTGALQACVRALHHHLDQQRATLPAETNPHHEPGARP